ncbi:MAG: phosphoglucosamine mutase, partial [Ruminococcaceae bacterium]|nr:phosphoglucosamine mutase [Oscillospiraceae bacterium]
MGRIFGTDGARGVAVTELTCELAMQIGRAAAYVLTKESGKAHPRILVGMDTRISSKILEAALSAGLASVGAQAELLGVVPTPAVAYLVKAYGADAGVMISASHNSVEYNGIKLFSGEGFKLPDSVEEEIEALILDRPEEIQLRDGTDVGNIMRRSNAAEDYINYIVKCINADLSGLNAAFDCANGSSAATAKQLFGALQINGGYIAHHP